MTKDNVIRELCNRKLKLFKRDGVVDSAACTLRRHNTGVALIRTEDRMYSLYNNCLISYLTSFGISSDHCIQRVTTNSHALNSTCTLVTVTPTCGDKQHVLLHVFSSITH